MVNRLSGYGRFTLRSGETLELKFCNGSTEIFARIMGFTHLSQINSALVCPVENGVPKPTATYLKALRVYVYAAAKYVCLAESKPILFNEWSASEWLEELGVNALMEFIDLPEPSVEEPGAKNQNSTDQSLKGYKANALARLNLLPAAYFDLTAAETSALLDGVEYREVFELRQTRRIATLLRNAHFEGPVSETEYMPLPGDHRRTALKGHTDPEVAFHLLGGLMGGEMTEEPTDPSWLSASDFVKVFGQTFRAVEGQFPASA